MGAPQKVYESPNAGLSKGETAVGTLGKQPSDFHHAGRSCCLINARACLVKPCKSESKYR